MKTVVVLSGGVDSATVLGDCVDQGDRVHCLSFDYGQRHSRELDSAAALCDYYGVDHTILPLSITSAKSSLTNPDVAVPHGHYAEESMKTTVVPARNLIMAAHAAAFAIEVEADRIALGVHQGDHAIYPDCRPRFVEALGQVLLVCDWHAVGLYTPLLMFTKGQVVNLGKQLGVPYELTWTCYEGGEAPCRACGACVERQEAFSA